MYEHEQEATQAYAEKRSALAGATQGRESGRLGSGCAKQGPAPGNLRTADVGSESAIHRAVAYLEGLLVISQSVENDLESLEFKLLGGGQGAPAIGKEGPPAPPTMDTVLRGLDYMCNRYSHLRDRLGVVNRTL